MFHTANPNINVEIKSFILVQTGTYREQAVRPFQTVVTTENINALATHTRDGTSINTASLRNVAGDIIRPQANVEGIAGIPNGWDSRRFRFMLKVVETNPFVPTDRVQRIYFGYSDHCDASVNHLPPDMRIYFNSETIVRDYTFPTPNGPVVEARVEGSNQIISPMDMAGSVMSAYHAQPAIFMLRPEDVFQDAHGSIVERKLESTNEYGNIDKRYSAHSMVGTGSAYKYSRRQDTTPTRYLNNTLTAYQNAIKEQTLGPGEVAFDQEAVFDTAMTYSENHQIASNGFFSILKDRAGFLEKGYVTFAELNQHFPETREQYGITHVGKDDGRSIRCLSHAQDSDYWTGSDNTSVAVALLAQCIPAIMMDNFIRQISFSAINGHGSGNYFIDFHQDTLRSIIDGVRLDTFLAEFERRLIYDCLNSFSHNNQIGFQLSMICDLTGDSIIDISLNGEPVRRYIAPTFTDSLFTPVITRSDTHIGSMSNDLTFLMAQTIQPDTARRNIITPTSTDQAPTTQLGNNNGHNSGFL